MSITDLGNKEVFARNLANYMERSGKTQKEMSEIVGVATSTFNNWMKAQKYPRIDKIEILADYFGILKSDLIEDKTKKPVTDDGLTESQRKLIAFAKTVPEDKAEMILRVIQSIVGSD